MKGERNVGKVVQAIEGKVLERAGRIIPQIDKTAQSDDDAIYLIMRSLMVFSIAETLKYVAENPEVDEDVQA